jgi:hypothetical protein
LLPGKSRAFYERHEDFSLFELAASSQQSSIIKDSAADVSRLSGLLENFVEININAGEKLRGIEGEIAFRRFLSVFRMRLED